MLWPVDRPAGTSAASQGLLSDRGSRLAWAGLSIGFAALSMLLANLTSTAMSTHSKPAAV
jgi:hypothetical protein